MRLISQDGMIDVPYENTIINCENNKADSYAIYADASHCFGLAIYSTEAKALKVMEMVREYKETKEIRSIPLTKSLMESFSNVKMENFEIYTDGTGDYLKVDIVKKVEYFKFPADEEVEV